jgi:S-methylmethionine-dependent homocysteine/selenocysteine methylase
MRDSWLRTLEAGEVLIVDGGTGAELRRRGVPLHRDVWSGLAALNHFDQLRDVHRDFIAAGAQVVTTNTFATSRFVLEAAGCGDRFAAINRRAVEAAQVARDMNGAAVAIAGSISCLPPSFDVNAYPDARRESAAYRELADLLAESGVELFILEMMQDTAHAARACAAVAATGLPFWLGVSCRFAADGQSLAMYDFPAVRLDTVLDALLPYGPAVVCAMHSPPGVIAAALAGLGARRHGYVGAYPEWPAAALGPHGSPAELGRRAAEWRRRGASVLGGCCGVTPEHIHGLRAAVAG